MTGRRMASTNTIDQCLLRLRLLCVKTKAQQDQTPNEADATLALYYEDWADLDDQLLTIAVQQWTSSGETPFYPTPGQIRQLAYRLVTVNVPDGARAWAMVKKILHETHVDIDPIPADLPQTLRTAIEAVGWRNLHTQTMQEEIGNRAHFIRVYDALKAREDEIAVMPEETRAQLAEVRARLRGAAHALSTPERLKLKGGKHGE